MSKTLLILGLLSGGMAYAADDKEIEEALDRFKAAYKNPSGPARAAAVTELARTPHEKTASKLIGILNSDVTAVRVAAALGLGKFADYKKQATPGLLGSLATNAKDPMVMEAIFQGLGELDDDTALPTIHRYFKDKEGKVAAAALASAAKIRNVSSIDLIIEVMKEYEKVEENAKKAASAGGGGYGGVSIPGGGGNDDPKRKLAKEVLPATVKAMQEITKEKWTTTQEWQIWWNRYKATFKIDK